MNPGHRQALTKALSSHVGAIAADLRAQMLAAGPVRDRAKKLHGEEQVGDDFDVWTDLLSRRAAVLWVLKTVYVRVLEDRGLVRCGFDRCLRDGCVRATAGGTHRGGGRATPRSSRGGTARLHSDQVRSAPRFGFQW